MAQKQIFNNIRSYYSFTELPQYFESKNILILLTDIIELIRKKELTAYFVCSGNSDYISKVGSATLEYPVELDSTISSIKLLPIHKAFESSLDVVKLNDDFLKIYVGKHIPTAKEIVQLREQLNDVIGERSHISKQNIGSHYQDINKLKQKLDALEQRINQLNSDNSIATNHFKLQKIESSNFDQYVDRSKYQEMYVIGLDEFELVFSGLFQIHQDSFSLGNLHLEHEYVEIDLLQRDLTFYKSTGLSHIEIYLFAHTIGKVMSCEKNTIKLSFKDIYFTEHDLINLVTRFESEEKADLNSDIITQEVLGIMAYLLADSNENRFYKGNSIKKSEMCRALSKKAIEFFQLDDDANWSIRKCENHLTKALKSVEKRRKNI